MVRQETSALRNLNPPRSPLGSEALRRAKAALIYKQTGNLRAVQILLGHTKIETTVRYLGVDVRSGTGFRFEALGRSE